MVIRSRFAQSQARIVAMEPEITTMKSETVLFRERISYALKSYREAPRFLSHRVKFA